MCHRTKQSLKVSSEKCLTMFKATDITVFLSGWFFHLEDMFCGLFLLVVDLLLFSQDCNHVGLFYIWDERTKSLVFTVLQGFLFISPHEGPFPTGFF